MVSSRVVDCPEVVKLAAQISANDEYPVYFRYASQIAWATCLPVVFVPEEVRAREIMQAIAALREEDYDRAKRILEKYLGANGESIIGGSTTLPKMVRDRLQKAAELRRSPEFVKLGDDWVTMFAFPEAPIALFP